MPLLLVPALLGLTLVQVHPVRLVDSIGTSGVQDGVYPGAVVVIGTADTILLKRGFGRSTWTSGDTPNPDSTLYDLASLTKVVATTSSVLVAIQRGMLALDTPLVSYLPDFNGPNKSRVTVRHLLTHRSGLRAFLPLHTMATDAEEAKQLVLAEPLRWPVGTRMVYSDLNAMLAGWAVESVTGQPLSEFAKDAVFRPLGMTQTRYGVAESDKSWAAPINLWRGHPIAGVVHDQNAERLGGVSGHAGLYSTGTDVARLSQWYLRLGRLRDGRRLVSERLIGEFTTRADANRAIGWEMKDGASTDNVGSRFSDDSYGHTGFTGTSIWVDPRRNVFVVLLTNRVMAPRHPRSVTELKRIRGAMADAAVELSEHACRIAQIVQPDQSCVAGARREEFR